MLLGIHDKLADFEITGVPVTFSAGVSSKEVEMVGVNVTPCNRLVLFAPHAGVSTEFDKGSVGVHAIFGTDWKKF